MRKIFRGELERQEESAPGPMGLLRLSYRAIGRGGSCTCGMVTGRDVMGKRMGIRLVDVVQCGSISCTLQQELGSDTGSFLEGATISVVPIATNIGTYSAKEKVITHSYFFSFFV